MIKVTWLGGPNDGKTFNMDPRQMPFVKLPEPADLLSLMRADEVSPTDTIRVRTVRIEQRVEEVYDENGVFEYAHMHYVADYNKGIVD